MLNQVADGVWVRQSAWVLSNAITSASRFPAQATILRGLRAREYMLIVYYYSGYYDNPAR
jgi:hypothetical protein